MVVTRRDLIAIIKQTEKPAVSIYMPTERTGDLQLSPKRFKNLLNNAEKMLVEQGQKQQAAKQILKRASELSDDASFWTRQTGGLAVFASPNVFNYFEVPVSLPEMVVVGDRFRIKPLIPAMSDNHQFYVLALSQKSVRLLQCTQYATKEVHVEGMPTGRADALKYDEVETVQGGKPGANRGSLRNQGQGEKDNKDAILRYFQLVNGAIKKALGDDRTPMVLVAVDYLHPLYAQANNYQLLLENGVIGNPDIVSEAELRGSAWKIVSPYFQRDEDKARADYNTVKGTGMAGTNIEEITQAAYDGKVSSVFISGTDQVWGTFNPDAREVKVQDKPAGGANEDDLLDFIAACTLVNSGQVYVVAREEVPDKGMVAAVYRRGFIPAR